MNIELPRSASIQPRTSPMYKEQVTGLLVLLFFSPAGPLRFRDCIARHAEAGGIARVLPPPAVAPLSACPPERKDRADVGHSSSERTDLSQNAYGIAKKKSWKYSETAREKNTSSKF